MRRLLLGLFLFASLASAQSKEPQLSDATHAKIRDIQLQQKNIEAQYLQTQQQLAKLEAQFNSLTPQLNDALDAAYKEAGVKKEDYSLDIGTLKFSKIEKKPVEDACHGQFGAGTDADPCRALPDCREPKTEREKQACAPVAGAAKGKPDVKGKQKP